MARQKIVIANWKMNLTVPESTVLLEKYVKEIFPAETEVVVCPSFLDIYSAEEVLKNAPLKVGAQNVHHEELGPYTGEVSADMLKGFAQYAICGHSERRHGFGETDKMVAKKAAACVRHGITPIVCVGENLHEKMDGLTKLVVAGQAEASLSELTSKEVGKIIIAYEPVWAIGTGHVCDAEKADEVAKNIRNLIKVLHGDAVANSVRIVYGGSIDDKNAKEFLGKEDIDGFLIGGSSLKHDVFAKIVAAVDSQVSQKEPSTIEKLKKQNTVVKSNRKRAKGRSVRKPTKRK